MGADGMQPPVADVAHLVYGVTYRVYAHIEAIDENPGVDWEWLLAEVDWDVLPEVDWDVCCPRLTRTCCPCMEGNFIGAGLLRGDIVAVFQEKDGGLVLVDDADLNRFTTVIPLVP
ncbi:MAG: hypothetical protein V3S32_00240 [Acidimicrobiia bacterium]